MVTMLEVLAVDSQKGLACFQGFASLCILSFVCPVAEVSSKRCLYLAVDSKSRYWSLKF